MRGEKVITFTDEGGEHVREEWCKKCWDSEDCEEWTDSGCNGKVHLYAIDEIYNAEDNDCYMIFARRCDKCDFESCNKKEY